MFNKILALGIILFFVLISSVFAQTIVKDDFRVNDDSDVGGSNQRMPAIAMDHEGNFVVVWVDERNGGMDIYGQRFDCSGNTLGENFKVNDAQGTGKYIGYNLGVAMDADGDFVVVWQDNRNMGSDIYAQRYDAAGTPIGHNFKVNDNLGGDQFGPAVAMNPSGEFVVAWFDNREGLYSLYGQRYSSSGEKTGNNFKIASVQTGRKFGTTIPAIAINPKGDFVATWIAQIYYQETDSLNLEIHTVRFNHKNEILGSEFKVNDSDSILFLNNPDVAMDAPGNFVITWMEKRTESQDIYAQRYNFKGEALGSNFRVNEVTGKFFKQFPKAVMNLSKKFAIAWLDSRDRGVNIYLQYYNQSGEPEGGNLKVADLARYRPFFFGVSKTPSGSLSLAWDGYKCSNDVDIFAMILNQKGEIVKESFKVNDDKGSSSQRNPAIAASLSDHFIISWDDLRFCDTDIFAQRFSSSGEFLGSNFQVNHEREEKSSGFLSSVAMDSSGNSVITFFSDYGIYFQRYDSDGNGLGENILVNESPLPYWATESDVVIDHRGSFVVVWAQMIGSLDQLIFAQLYTPQGEKVGTNFIANSFLDTAQSSDHPKVAKSANGSFVIVWQNSYKTKSDVEIWGQLYNQSGERIGVNFEISDSAVCRYNQFPDVGADENGNFVVSWLASGNIFIQRFKADGSKIGPIIKAIYPQVPKFNGFSLAVKPSGEFLVTWTDNRNGNPDIYAQRFDAEGNPLGGNFRVNNDQGDNIQQSPVVATDDKNYYFAWGDNRDSGSGFDIFCKVISFEPTFVSDEELLNKPQYILLQNYPNPFNPATTIPFCLKAQGSTFKGPIHTTLTIYNLLGQKVKTLVDEDKLSGSYQVIWDGKNEEAKDVGSGIYFYVIKTKELTQTKKMTLVR